MQTVVLTNIIRLIRLIREIIVPFRAKNQNMAKVAYKIRKVTFEELQELFIKHCEKLGLFEHSKSFGYTPEEAFNTYFYCWRRYLVRNGEIREETFSRWKRRGWIDEERYKDFMIYCFGNRW